MQGPSLPPHRKPQGRIRLDCATKHFSRFIDV
jgi:hypothetical protein